MMAARKSDNRPASHPPINSNIKEIRQSSQYQKLKRLVEFYAIGQSRTEYISGLADLYADLRHVCDELGLNYTDWAEALEAGQQSYEKERGR